MIETFEYWFKNFLFPWQQRNINLPKYIYYRLQTKLREGYVFIGVCDSVQGVVSQHALQLLSQHALQQVSGGVSRHTPGGGLQAHTQGGPQAHNQEGGIPACTEADTPPPTATAAGGTHPTGMHSCFF